MKLTIKKYGINGEGIAYDRKIPVFIKGALKNEEVEARLLKSFGSYRTAALGRIYEASPERKNIDCPYFDRCGACSLMHATYQEQLAIKAEILEESLRKYADIHLPFEIIENDVPVGYRNLLKMPVGDEHGKLVCGFYPEGSNRFATVPHCLIHEPLLEKKKNEVLKVLNSHHLRPYDRHSKKGIRYLVMRTIGGNISLCLVTGEGKVSESLIQDLKKIEGITSAYQSVNTTRGKEVFGRLFYHLYGGKYLTFKYDGLKLALSTRAFYQLNTKQAEKLYALVEEKMGENNNLVVEAYAGIGVMSMLAARRSKKVIGVEIVQEAVYDATRSAKVNRLDNVEFVCDDSGSYLNDNLKKRTIDLLIVDPPRSGLDEKMIDAIMSSNIKRIIYVSCSPSSLSQNLSDLQAKYEVESIDAVDIFTNTAHLETVAVLARKSCR